MKQNNNCKTIFIVLHRAFSVRYILETDILKKLLEYPIKIVILHPDHNDPYFINKFKNDKIFLESFPEEECVKLIKKSKLGSLLNQVRYYTYSGQKDNDYSTRKIFQYYHSLNGGKRYTIIKLFSSILRFSKLSRRFVLFIESFYFSSQEIRSLFKKYKPSAMLISSIGYSLDSPVMRQAKKKRCKIISIVHSWDNPSTKGYRGADPDNVIAWNNIMKDELVKYHDLKPENVFIGGIPHWDNYFNNEIRCSYEEFINRYNIESGKKIIFYAPTGYKHIYTTLDVIEYLAEKIRDNQLKFPSHLIVRLHPGYMVKEKGKWAKKIENDLNRVNLMAQKYNGCLSFSYPEVIKLNKQYIYPINDMYKYADILYHSNVMVTEYSTCMIEACIFDLPVVNVAYQKWKDTNLLTSETLNHFSHLKRIFKLNAIRQAYSPNELVELIDMYMENKNIDKNERHEVVEQECSINRGNSGSIIAEHIYSSIQDRKYKYSLYS